MPNDCNNTLVVRGTLTQLKEFFAENYNQHGQLRFGLSLPYKIFADSKQQEWDALTPETKKTWSSYLQWCFNNGGYDWCCKNWGTKWDTYGTETPTLTLSEDKNSLTEDEYALTTHFHTAWSPPTRMIEYYSTRYPELKFELYYEEFGCGFQGRHWCWQGRKWYEESYDLNYDLDEQTDTMETNYMCWEDEPQWETTTPNKHKKKIEYHENYEKTAEEKRKKVWETFTKEELEQMLKNIETLFTKGEEL